MEVLVITILVIVNLLLVLAVIIANAIISEKKEIIQAQEKVIAALVEKNDYQSCRILKAGAWRFRRGKNHKRG